FAPEKRRSFTIGLSALANVLAVAISVPHFVINAHKLAKDLKGTDWDELKKREGSFIGALRRAFIDRENKIKSEGKIYKDLAESEALIHGVEPTEYTEEQTQFVRETIE